MLFSTTLRMPTDHRVCFSGIAVTFTSEDIGAYDSLKSRFVASAKCILAENSNLAKESAISDWLA
jgi:hypothetical protein